MPNISKMAASHHRAVLFIAVSIGLLILTGCAISRTAAPVKIVLFAPFEGRYREVGYEMLYAARLALVDAGQIDNTPSIELLPIDDGGSPDNARDHAAAIALDSEVRIVIAAGFAATDPDVLTAFDDLPVIVVGSWQPKQPAQTQANTFFLTPRDAVSTTSIESDSDLVVLAQQSNSLIGGELLSLQQFRRLREDVEDVTILSSAVLPSPDFVARYQALDAFAPEPGLLSTLTYDAMNMAVQNLASGRTRREAADQLRTMQSDGINGRIRFDSNGYWQDTPLHRYQYDAYGQLVEVTESVSP